MHWTRDCASIPFEHRGPAPVMRGVRRYIAMNPAQPQLETWEELRAYGKQVVDALIARLPDELRPDALRIGYELHRRCRDEHLWGRYSQSATLIELFLEAIREDCIEEPLDFCT